MANHWKYWDEDGEHEWVAHATLPRGTDLFKVAFLNQFVDAINERMKVCVNFSMSKYYKYSSSFYYAFESQTQGYWSAGLLPEFVVGEDVQAVDSIRRLQARLLTDPVFYDQATGPHALYLGFLRSTELSGSADCNASDFFPTAAAFLVSAGLNAAGPRRSTDGSTFAYGLMQIGDVIGAWIFEDLRILLSRLTTNSRNLWNYERMLTTGALCTSSDETASVGSMIEILHGDLKPSCSSVWEQSKENFHPDANYKFNQPYKASLYIEGWLQEGSDDREWICFQHASQLSVTLSSMNPHGTGWKSIHTYALSQVIGSAFGSGLQSGIWVLLSSHGSGVSDTFAFPTIGTFAAPGSLIGSLCPGDPVGGDQWHRRADVSVDTDRNVTRAVIEWNFQYE